MEILKIFIIAFVCSCTIAGFIFGAACFLQKMDERRRK